MEEKQLKAFMFKVNQIIKKEGKKIIDRLVV